MNFEVTTHQLVINNNTGKQYNKVVLYMVKAMSFGEAEDITHKYLIIKGRVGRVKAIVESNVSKVDPNTHDLFFKVKIVTTEENETTGKEQDVRYYHLISSDKPEEAIQIARERFSDTYKDDYTIDQSLKTPFIDILNY